VNTTMADTPESLSDSFTASPSVVQANSRSMVSSRA
jgi:hypothetical protein